MNSNPEGTGGLNVNTVGHSEASSSSWVEEEGRFVSRKSKSFQVILGSGCVPACSLQE